MNSIVLFGLVIMLKCDVIHIDGIRMRNGNVVNVNNYYWSNGENNQFSYDIDVDTTHIKGSDEMRMFIFIISPQHFDKVNILSEHTFCCVDNYVTLCTTDESNNNDLISNLSLYYDDHTILSKEKERKMMSFHGKSNKTMDYGIYGTFIAFCPNKVIVNYDNLSISIKGLFTYNSDKGFLSFDDYYLILLYILIIGFSCIILFLWIYLMIRHRRDNNSNGPCSNTFTITIPFFIGGKIIYLISLIIRNQTGRLILSLVYLKMVMDGIVGIVFMFILSGVSVGYTLDLQSKIYKMNEKKMMFFPQKKRCSFLMSLILYTIGLCSWEIFSVLHTYHQMNIIYLAITLTMYIISNTMIVLSLYRRIKKKENNMTTLIDVKNYLRKYRIVLIGCISFTIAYVLSICLYRFISKYLIVAYFKWIGPFLFECQSLLLYSSLPILLISIPQSKPKERYEIELADRSLTTSETPTDILT